MLEEYRKHVAERAAEGIAPKPLDANQMAALVELLKNPPAGEEEFLLDLLTNRVPPGVDEAAYVKAGFLAAIAKGEAKSPLLTPEKAIELLTHTPLSINEIADQTGFSTARYFSTVFKQHTGLSPSQYRETPPSASTTHPG